MTMCKDEEASSICLWDIETELKLIEEIEIEDGFIQFFHLNQNQVLIVKGKELQTFDLAAKQVLKKREIPDGSEIINQCNVIKVTENKAYFLTAQ